MLEPEENLASKILAALREAAPSAQVDVGHNLEEAQRLVLNDRPDLFVLDVDAMPDLGQEFLYDLRTSHPHARAIVLTGVHFAAHRERAQLRAQQESERVDHFIERRIEDVLNRVNIPSRSDIERLNRSVETLTRKVETLIAREARGSGA